MNVVLNFTAETLENSAIKRKEHDTENKFNNKGNMKGNIRNGNRPNFNRNKLMQNDTQQKRKVLINPHFKGNVPIRNNGNVELLYSSFSVCLLGKNVVESF